MEINILDRQGAPVGGAATFMLVGNVVSAWNYIEFTGLYKGETYTVSLLYDNTILYKIEYLA